MDVTKAERLKRKLKTKTGLLLNFSSGLHTASTVTKFADLRILTEEK
jgi:hypothetical protein